MNKRGRKRRRKRVIRLVIMAAVVVAIIAAIIVIIVSCANRNSNGQDKSEGWAESGIGSDDADLNGEAANDDSQNGAGGDGQSIEEGKSSNVTHTAEDYARDGIDELFAIPVLMYHRIYDMKSSETEYTGGNVDADGYNRTSEAFAADLEMYYQWGYRCVRLTDMVDGKIDTPYGYSPLVITFDDGIEQCDISGFDADGKPIFSSRSALAILEEMKAKHPDFNVTATFFVNQGLFGNDGDLDEKLVKWMVENGYDIGNHTMSHPMISGLSEDEIQEEVGGVYKILEDIIPGQYVNIVALPYGDPTDTTEDTKYEKIFKGSYEGLDYTTKAALLCAWTYSESPFNRSFNVQNIKRIRGYDNNGENFDITYNFNMLNDGKRYYSDGNPDTIVIHKEDREYLGDIHGREVVEY